MGSVTGFRLVLVAALMSALVLLAVSQGSSDSSSSSLFHLSGASLLVVVAITIAVLSSILAMGDFEREDRATTVALFVLTALLLVLAAASRHLVAWLVFYELSSFPLILYLFRARERASTAAMLLAVFTVASGIVIALGVLIAYSERASFWFEDFEREGSLLAGALIAAGLILKLPAIPLHYWLVLVYSAVPPHLGVIAVSLEGATMLFMLEVAGRTLILPALREAGCESSLALLLSAIGALSMVYASLQGLASKTSREVLAFSSIAHANAVLLVLAASVLEDPVDSLKLLDIAGYYVVAYVISKSAWFLLSGALEKTSGDMLLDKLRGSARSHPVLYTIGLTTLFMILPSPPSLKFFSELFLILMAPSECTMSIAIAALLALGLALAVAIAVRFIYVVWVRSETEAEPRASPALTLVSVSLLSLVLIAGGFVLAAYFTRFIG
ncbi:MAG: proton-conducting transporter membrane subunit [Acidilobaceae archaeon]